MWFCSKLPTMFQLIVQIGWFCGFLRCDILQKWGCRIPMSTNVLAGGILFQKSKLIIHILLLFSPLLFSFFSSQFLFLLCLLSFFSSCFLFSFSFSCFLCYSSVSFSFFSSSSNVFIFSPFLFISSRHLIFPKLKLIILKN